MKRKIRRIGIGLIVMIILINCFIQFIYIKEVTRFESYLETSLESSGFFSFSKKSLLGWSKNATNFDIDNLEEDLKDLDDNQRLIVSFGRELSFFYIIRPFEGVEVKYKNNKVTNYVYVYKVNYKGPIIDYTVY